MLDRVTVDTFAPAVGQAFAVEHDDVTEMDLDEAATLTADAPAVDSSGRRSPFRLIFRGPPAPVLEQRIYRLSNELVGALEVFIVPIANNDDGTDYEAIFT